MKGAIKNNQFDITVSEKNVRTVPNIKIGTESYTNMAGITYLNNKLYCLKANSSNHSSISYTDNYMTVTPKSLNIKIDAHCVGLTNDGNNLVSIGKNSKKEWNVYVINTRNKKVVSYPFDTKGSYYGITHIGHNGFYTLYSNDKNKTLIVKEFFIYSGSIYFGNTFTLVNSGYAEMIQDIYYGESFGLFVATNQKKDNSYSPCKNIILLYNLKNKQKTTKANLKFRVNLSTTKYKQYNIESICIVNKKLVMCANVVTSDNKTNDMLSYADYLTFDQRGTVVANWDIEYGREFDTRTLKDSELVDKADKGAIIRTLQSLSYANGKVYGLMIYTCDNYEHRNYSGFFEMPDYMNRKLPQKGNTKYIAVNKYTKNIKENQEDPKNLYHCNSLNFDGTYFYVGCCEKKIHAKKDENGKLYYTIMKMNIKGKLLKRYKFEYRTNCVIPYKDGKFIIIGGEKYNINGESMERLYVGSFKGDRFVAEDHFYIRNTIDTCTLMQDAYYNKNTGLMLARFVLPCKYNALLHYDLDKYITDKATVSGVIEEAKILTPDYALYLDVDKDGGDFETMEYESPTVDEINKRLIIGCNARGYKGTKIAGSNDCIITFKDLTVTL